MLGLYMMLEDASELARDIEKRAKQSAKQWYDKNARARKFSVGEQVLVLLPDSREKFSAQWDGPYTVKNQLSDVNYKVCLPDHKKKEHTFHIIMMKLWKIPAVIHTVMCIQEDPDEVHTDSELPVLTWENEECDTRSQPISYE